MANRPIPRYFWQQLLIGANDTPHSGCQDIACAEEGKVTFLALIAMLAFVVLIGFVGNVGHSVHQKLELQNAADAASYSTTVWMARGMNAVTTTNHLMGEMTALMVMIESLGGPELDGEKEENEEIKKLNKVIMQPWVGKGDKTLPLDLPSVLEDAVESLVGELAKKFGPEFIGAQGSVAQSTTLSTIDQEFIEQVQELMAKDDAGKQDAGAAIYDSQCSMKFYVGKLMKYKFLTNIGYVIGAIFAEPASSAATCAIHVVLDVGIADVCKDWILVRGLEILGRPLRKFVEFDKGKAGAGPYLILALSLYGDSVAKPGRLEEPIQKTLDQLKKDYAVNELSIFPAPADLSLPVVAEEKPKPPDSTQTNKKLTIPPTLWEQDESSKYSVFAQIVNAPEKLLRDTVAQVNRWLAAFQVVSWLGGGGDISISADDILDDLGFPKQWEKLNDSDVSVGNNETVKDLQPGGWGYPENFTLPNRESIPKIDWEAERYTQWARATYPYVDSFRGSWCKFFSDTMGPSNFWTYYKNWTNRYTLAMSYRIRSGTIFPSGLNNLSNQPQVDELREKLRAWQARLRELRVRFDKAREGPASFEELMSFDKDDFPEIAVALRKLADDIIRELVGGAGIDTAGMNNWHQAVQKMNEPVDDAKRDATTNFDPDAALEQSDFAGLFGKTAPIEITHTLLRMLEELLGKAENALALLDLGPPHMYVMRDMQPLNKGNEIWTHDSRRAAEMFTVVATAYRNPWTPAFSPALYKTPYSKRGTYSFSQSMFYAANGRREIKDVGQSTQQPNTGWDTLNWAPSVRAPEWGLSDPSHEGARPWDVLIGKHQPLRSAQVQINWLAKLVPITPDQLQNATRAISNKDRTPAPKIESSFILH